jgi:hypothetical protein
MNRDLVLCEVFLEAYRRKKPISFVLSGSSMYPVLREGDVIVAYPIASADTVPGDILACQNLSSKKILVHRLIKKSSLGGHCFLHTAADGGSRLVYDKSFSERDHYIAKVVSVIRNRREIDLTTTRSIISGRIRALLLKHFFPIIYLQHRFLMAVEGLSSGRK